MGLYTYSMYEYVYAYVRKYIRKVYLIYHIRESVILCKKYYHIGSIGNTVSTLESLKVSEWPCNDSIKNFAFFLQLY